MSGCLSRICYGAKLDWSYRFNPLVAPNPPPYPTPCQIFPKLWKFFGRHWLGYLAWSWPLLKRRSFHTTLKVGLIMCGQEHIVMTVLNSWCDSSSENSPAASHNSFLLTMMSLRHFQLSPEETFYCSVMFQMLLLRRNKHEQIRQLLTYSKSTVL